MNAAPVAGGEGARRGVSPAAATVLVREVVVPPWPWRLPLPSRNGLTRRQGAGLVRLLGPAVVAVAQRGPRVVFAARAADEATARAAIARMRFATAVDDDLADFHERFRDDPLIGRAVRARPELRVRRTPTPWEALMWAITEQLIDGERATAIQRALTARLGPRAHGLRDAPAAQTVAAQAPALLVACGLAEKRAFAMQRAARRPDFGPGWRERLEAIPEIGTWTVEMAALHGLGELDQVPAADLGYLKLVGRLLTGNPKAVADEAEVRGVLARYAPYRGLAGSYLLLSRPRPVLRPAGTRPSAARTPTAAV